MTTLHLKKPSFSFSYCVWIAVGLFSGFIVLLPQAFAVGVLQAISSPSDIESIVTHQANTAPISYEAQAKITTIPNHPGATQTSTPSKSEPHIDKLALPIGKACHIPNPTRPATKRGCHIAKPVAPTIKKESHIAAPTAPIVIKAAHTNELSSQPKRTIERIISYTLKTNPEVLRADAQKRVASAEVDVTQGSLLPNVDLFISAGRDQSSNAITQFRPFSQTRSNKDLSISQLLWDGWGAVNQIVAAKSQYQALNFQLAEQQELTALRVTEVYLDTLRFSVLTKLAQDNLYNHNQTLHKVHLRVVGGAGQTSDEDLARSRVTEAQATLYSTRALLNDAKNAYIEVVNLQPEHLQFPQVPTIPKDDQSVLMIAFHHSPAIKVAMQNIRTAKANLNAAQSGYFPKVSLNLAVNRDRNLGGFAGPNNNSQALINFRYNLFKGGADKASIRKSAYQVYASTFAYQSVPRTVRRNTISAWQNYQIAKDRTAQLQARVYYIEKVIVAYHKQFELGQRSLFDLLEMERELFNAKSELTNSRFQIYSNAYRLLASMGVLVSRVESLSL